MIIILLSLVSMFTGVVFVLSTSVGAIDSAPSCISGAIFDSNNPSVQDDCYTIGIGQTLIVSVSDGLLKNDKDVEGPVGDVILITEAVKIPGSLDLKPDGSFKYIPRDSGYVGDVFFSYQVSDNSGNFNKATVRITFGDLVVNASIRNESAAKSNYAKAGDVIRVVFDISEPITEASVKIAERHATVHMIDSTHYYADYTIPMKDPNFKVTRITYSVVVSSVDNKGAAYPEDVIIFDQVAPIIKLAIKPDCDIYIGIHKPYIEVNEGYNPNSDCDVAAGNSNPDKAGLYVLSYDEVDMAGNKALTFTRTIDVIDQNKPYLEVIEVDDTNLGGVFVTGNFNPDKAGSYVLSYDAVDMAGNKALTVVNRTIHVIDPMVVYYNEISDELASFGLISNIGDANTGNYRNFTGLYVEKYIYGTKVGRITFNDPVDLSGDMEAFLYELIDRMQAESVGTVGIDLTDATSSIDYSQLGATVTFYNLDKLGYAGYSTKDDIYNAITAYDDDGNITDGSALDYDSAVYVGCGPMQVDCYTFTVKVAHFSKYVIGYNTVAPPVEPLVDPIVEVSVEQDDTPMTRQLSNAGLRLPWR